MKFLRKIVGTLLLIAAISWIASVVADRKMLSENIIRLHVVARSDSPEDQAVKLKVRDAIVASLQQDMDYLEDSHAAKTYITEKLDQLTVIANDVLEQAGCTARAVVTLAKEAFPKRDYDTFSLPGGVYESLRVTIGEGEGKNWWCVVFPSLCLPATSEEFEDTAAGSGFDDSLTDTLQQKDGYKFRFFFLDCLGWLQNLFFGG